MAKNDIFAVGFSPDGGGADDLLAAAEQLASARAALAAMQDKFDVEVINLIGSAAQSFSRINSKLVDATGPLIGAAADSTQKIVGKIGSAIAGHVAAASEIGSTLGIAPPSLSRAEPPKPSRKRSRGKPIPSAAPGQPHRGAGPSTFPPGGGPSAGPEGPVVPVPTSGAGPAGFLSPLPPAPPASIPPAGCSGSLPLPSPGPGWTSRPQQTVVQLIPITYAGQQLTGCFVGRPVFISPDGIAVDGSNFDLCGPIVGPNGEQWCGPTQLVFTQCADFTCSFTDPATGADVTSWADIAKFCASGVSGGGAPPPITLPPPTPPPVPSPPPTPPPPPPPPPPPQPTGPAPAPACPCPTGEFDSCIGKFKAEDALPMLAQLAARFTGLLAAYKSPSADQGVVSDCLYQLRVALTAIEVPVPLSFAAAIGGQGTAETRVNGFGQSVVGTAMTTDTQAGTTPDAEPIGSETSTPWEQVTAGGFDGEFSSAPEASPYPYQPPSGPGGYPATGAPVGTFSAPTNGHAPLSTAIAGAAGAFATPRSAAPGSGGSSSPRNPAPAGFGKIPLLKLLGGMMSVSFNEPIVCEVVLQFIGQIGNDNLASTLYKGGFLNDAFEVKFARDRYVALENDHSLTAGWKRAWYNGLNNSIIYLIRFFDTLAGYVSLPGGSTIVSLILPLLVGWADNLLIKWTGLSIDKFSTSTEYLKNLLAPTDLPGPEASNLAYLSGQIPDALWECWIRANNQLPKPAALVRDSLQSRLSEGDLLSAWRRGLYSDDELRRKFRQRRWLDDDDVSVAKQLTQNYPSPQDIIRLMVRDVADPNIVQGFDLDREFAQKYQGFLRQWGQFAGMPDDVMLALWRAHWAVPSFTQLQQMLFRLRPDKYGDTKDPLGYRYATTVADVNLALSQNDVAPFWRNKLLEISYRPMRQVDARRAYTLGYMSEAQLRSHFADIGINPRELEPLVGFSKSLRWKALQRHQWVQAYIQSSSSQTDMWNALFADGYGQQEILDVTAWADRTIAQHNRKLCVAAIKRKYLSGALADADLPQTLQRAGLDVPQIVRLMDLWRCLLTTRPKELTASQTCRLLAAGLITQQEMATRLSRLGYTPDAVQGIMLLCQGDIDKKAKAAAAKEAKARAKKGRQPTQAELCRMFTAGQITQAEFAQRLTDSGFDPSAIQGIIEACATGVIR